jgi:hypothetical protein
MGSWQKPVGIGTMQEREEVLGRLLETDQLSGYDGVPLECDPLSGLRSAGVLPEMRALARQGVDPAGPVAPNHGSR